MNKIFENLKNSFLILLSGFLWKAGGSGYKFVRRFIFPTLLGIICYLNTGHIWASLITSAFGGFFSLGYGIPSKKEK